MKALFLLLALVAFVYGSSHSESPNTVESPISDWSDLYAFRSTESGRDGFFTILGNIYPLQAPYAGPNYYAISDQYYYQIYIDNDGDCAEEWTFSFVFGSSFNAATKFTGVYPTSDFDCSNQVNGSAYGTINGGLALNIGGKVVPVQLKQIGSLGEGSDSSRLNYNEFYTITYITGDRDSNNQKLITQSGTSNTQFTKPFDNAGSKTFPNGYAKYANQFIYDIDIPGCTKGSSTQGRLFVGQRSEPFYINLGKIFDLVNLIPIPGFPGAVQQDASNNALAGASITTLALELPRSCYPGNKGAIGIWTATRKLVHGKAAARGLRDSRDAHHPGLQTSRLGNPLINELAIGLRDKHVYSRSEPVDDIQFGLYVEYPTFPAILSLLFLPAVNANRKSNGQAALKTLAPTNFPRLDLVQVFLIGLPGLNIINPAKNAPLCDILRLNHSVAAVQPENQNPLGVIDGDAAGFPNGRRVGDDVVDIALSVFMGKVCYLGLGICTEAQANTGNVSYTDGAPIQGTDFPNKFPYLNPPLPGSEDFDSAASSIKPFWL